MPKATDWLSGEEAVKALSSLQPAKGTMTGLIERITIEAGCDAIDVTILRDEGRAEVLVIIPARCTPLLGQVSRAIVEMVPATVRAKLYALDEGRELDTLLSTFMLGGIEALCIAHEALLQVASNADIAYDSEARRRTVKTFEL